MTGGTVNEPEAETAKEDGEAETEGHKQQSQQKEIGHAQGKDIVFAVGEDDAVFLREQICIQVIHHPHSQCQLEMRFQISFSDAIGIGQSAFVSRILGEYIGISVSRSSFAPSSLFVTGLLRPVVADGPHR